jgi:predicted DNA-binding protein
MLTETIVRLSGERAQRLGQLAAERGVTEAVLVEQALDMLFLESILPDGEVDDLELLRRIEAEVGPLPPVRSVPPILPENIVSAIPVRI